MTFKSNPFHRFITFLPPIFIAALFLAALSLAPDNGDYIVYEVIAAFIIVCGSAYNAFYICNIAISVSETNVSFTRFEREYLSLSFGEYYFTSYVIKHVIGGFIPAGSTRYLKAAPKDGGKARLYRCHCFDADEFDEFIASVERP